MIGIRQADGSFYEIMGDAQSGHKRLVLSAARTDQNGVRIDLYRSTDGTIGSEGALGSLVLEDAGGLGYQDISFRVDLDANDQLAASASLPGQPPQTLAVDLGRFRSAEPSPSIAGLDELPDLDDLSMDMDEPPRSDSDILQDESLDSAELDTLEEFNPELDPEVSIDLPDAEDEPPRRSDSDILADESFESAELDTLDDFSLEDEAGTPETRGLDEMLAPEPIAEAESDPMDFSLDDLSSEEPTDSPPKPADDFSMDDMGLDDLSLDDLGSEPSAPAAAAFDLGDLDAGFGDEPAPAAEEAEEWEKISLDDMEPMEFLDTGAEISAPPKAKPAPPSSSLDDFSMDEEPLELADFDSDLSDLPDLGDSPSPKGADSFDSFDNDLDQDFLAPSALTEEPAPWNNDEDEALPASKPGKEPKPAKKAKAKPSAPAPHASSNDGGLDKAALFLSLAALSLLVLLILVLLFLNMIKAPQAPVIQPEVERWKETSLAQDAAPTVSSSLDLGSLEPVALEADSVLEIPTALRSARISLVLEPGDTVESATSRFGSPAQVQGNKLSW